MTGQFVPAVALAPGETHAHAAAREIERYCDRGGWDQPNHLFALVAVPGGVSVEPFGPPFENHAALFLMGLAEKLVSDADVAAKVRGVFPRLCGLAVAVETWAVQVPREDPATAAAVRAAADRRELHTHPDRQDARVVLVLMATGDEAAVQHVRGFPADVGVDCPGNIQTALRALHLACLLTSGEPGDG